MGRLGAEAVNALNSSKGFLVGGGKLGFLLGGVEDFIVGLNPLNNRPGKVSSL